MRWFLFFWMLLEIVVIVLVAELIGVVPTILLIILTTLLGFVILRGESFAIISRIQARLQQGKPPLLADFDSSITMIAGMLLIIPGFLSDVLGLICWIPGIRHAMKKGFSKAAKGLRKKSGQPDIIEGEYWHEKKQVQENKKKSHDEKDKRD